MRCDELDEILHHRRLSSWFQPLVQLQEHRILGYEALVRGPSDSPLHSPIKLFDAAQRCGRLVDLELLCREVHILNFARLKLPGKLFLNVNPLTLQQPDFPSGFTLRSLARFNLRPEDVVIELTEQTPIDDYELLRETLSHYRRMGFAVAIDDLGAGYAGLRLWSELRPEYVKFDKHFIQGVNEDNDKRQFIRSLQEIALGLGCTTIAEGIENQDEYEVVKALGINIGQGYHFDRPKPAPLRELPLQRPPGGDHYRVLPGNRNLTLASLVRPVVTVEPQVPMTSADALFDRHPDLWVLPVVEGGRPVGLLRRHDFLKLFASRYGRDLFAREPVSRFMDQAPLILDQHTPLEKVSQEVTAHRQLQPGDDILVTDGGHFAGIGNILDLLRRITELQIRNARYANPLTLLPGNVPINETLEELLTVGAAFTVCYIDLDNFKPFNDFYDYQRGDRVLQMLAKLLQDLVVAERDFVGHIGGDDFMVVFQSEDWECRCRRILDTFARKIESFYEPEHRQSGGIHALNRNGEAQFHPLMTLSIGATRPPLDRQLSCHDLAAWATEAKRQAKQIPGNVLFIDRRSHQQAIPGDPEAIQQAG